MFDNTSMSSHFFRCRAQFLGGVGSRWSINGDPAALDGEPLPPPGQPFSLGRIHDDELGSHARLYFDDENFDPTPWFTGRTIVLLMAVDHQPQPDRLQVQLERMTPAFVRSSEQLQRM